MTIAQRKIELINWITSLTSEEHLNQIEELKNASPSSLSEELVYFLQSVDTDKTEGLREHTSVKQIKR